MQTIEDQDMLVKIDAKRFLRSRSDCDEILLLSKTTPSEGGKVWMGARDRAHCPCKCYSRNLRREIYVYHLVHKFVWPWPADLIEPCDEIAGSDFLKGCYVKGSGTLKLRRHKCEHGDTLVGCEYAEIVIYRPAGTGFLPVFQGQLRGTVGLEPHADGKARCCAPNHNEGSIVAKGVGGMEECSLCATYQGTFHKLHPDEVCRGIKISWDGHVDGIVCCPCEEHHEEYQQKQG